MGCTAVLPVYALGVCVCLQRHLSSEELFTTQARVGHCSSPRKMRGEPHLETTPENHNLCISLHIHAHKKENKDLSRPWTIDHYFLLAAPGDTVVPGNEDSGQVGKRWRVGKMKTPPHTRAQATCRAFTPDANRKKQVASAKAGRPSRTILQHVQQQGIC